MRSSLIFWILLSFIPIAHALDPNNLRLIDHLVIEEILNRDMISTKVRVNEESDKSFLLFLNDPKKRVRKEFQISSEYRSDVIFWYKIYNQFSSAHQVIHDMDDVRIVYESIDYSDLGSSALNRFVKSNLQVSYGEQQVRLIKKYLNILKIDLDSKSKGAQRLRGIIQKAKTIPKEKNDREIFFTNLAKNIRIQTGQRDNIFQGLINSIPYQKFIFKTFKQFGIPKELLAIAFLESSFNPIARSKVNAAGIWQIMPYIGRRLFPTEEKISDERFNPYLATLGAAHLFRQNIRITKRWDLAITAYNSGVGRILSAKKKYKRKFPGKKMTLNEMFVHFPSAGHGFASKAFYPSFLALVHTLAYQDQLFPLKGIDTRLVLKESPPEDIYFYLLKCPLKPSYIMNHLKRKNETLKAMNRHFKNINKVAPRGSIFVSGVKLNKKKYKLVTDYYIKKKYPKHWIKLLKNQRCSTR